MARVAARLPENVAGDFYVDDTCIDCATCRHLAPRVFGRTPSRDLSYVRSQPSSPDEKTRALMALVACPTASIGTVGREDVRAAVALFPETVEEEVEYCGFTAAASFGASGYFIKRARGNVLVDSPRAAEPLMRRLAQRGGVRRMFLTHRDDVADHRRFRDRFGCERILHRDDVTASTSDVERTLEGREPVRLADDLVAIPVPGHTRGSAALLYREKFLFTGDHLWWSEDRRALHASRDVCWYSWPEQVRSLECLLDWRFEWILPGHGDRYRAASVEAMHGELEALIERLKRAG